MSTSQSIKEIALALSAAQAEMKPAEMNATNPFLKNRYADLGAIMKVARDPLAKNGLSFTQLVGGHEGMVNLETILMHKSGEWISTIVTVPLATSEKGRNLAQEIGAMITYLKRYSLASILGIFSEEDTDGAAKKESKQETKKDQPPAGNGNGKVPMTLEEAMKVQSSEGKNYGDIDTATLTHMANAISTAKVHKPEHDKKLLAIQIILQARARSDTAEQALRE